MKRVKKGIVGDVDEKGSVIVWMDVLPAHWHVRAIVLLPRTCSGEEPLKGRARQPPSIS